MAYIKSFFNALASVVWELVINIFYPLTIFLIFIEVFKAKLEYEQKARCFRYVNIEKEIKTYVINTCWWVLIIALGLILWKINMILN